MSRIHDALKKAELDRTDGAAMEADPRVREGASVTEIRTEASQPLVTVLPSGFDGFPSPAELPRVLQERCVKPAWNPDRKTMLSFDRRSRVGGLEEFRTLRSHLNLIRDRQQLQRILITSPLPLEGKSFVAMNLAQVMVRQHDLNVLLIDGDLRMSRIHQAFGAPRSPGLTEYLAGKADEFAIVQRGPVENFFFIPGGKSISNPSELIGAGRLKVLLDRLAPAFDWIILDSPPVVPVADAKLLADVCDGVLMVIQAGATPFDLAQKACQEFREKRLLGVVLNRAEGGNGYGYHYYDRTKPKKNGKRKG